MNLDFSNVVVAEVVKEPKQVVSRAIPRNPEGMRIRLFKDGACFPSQELVEQFNLSYTDKEDSSVGNGFDIVDSRKWEQVNKVLNTPYIFITATPKNQSKVDLFAHVTYDKEGKPSKSVMEQGSKRVELIEMIREVYDLSIEEAYIDDQLVNANDKLFGDKNYVDLEVHVSTVLPTSTSVFYLPKSVARGPRKGQADYEVREGSVFHPLTVVQ